MTLDNRAVPPIPVELVPLWEGDEMNEFVEQVIVMWNAVCDEVLDPKYITRHHSNTGTYDQGCRGPLCRKAYREHPRRKNPQGISLLAPRYERVFDPILEYFHTVAKFRIRQQQIFERIS